MIATLQELDEFRQFAAEQLGMSNAELTLEDLVERWRLLSPSPAELDENVRAVKESVEDLKNGERGQPFDQFVKEFRVRHNLAES